MPDIVRRAGEALVNATEPDAKVILFGSYSRGEEKSDSDLDFLVIEAEVSNRIAESARLGKLIGELGIPADVVVVSESQAQKWGSLPGTMLYDALHQGQRVAG